jgi:hypothetical protein
MGDVGLNKAMEYINYVKKQKMAQGGFVGGGAGSDMTPTMMGGGMGNVQDAIMADGGEVTADERKDARKNNPKFKF